MKTIWKFELRTTDAQDVSMPFGAEVLHVREQRGAPCLWALVDPEAEPTTRCILTVGTGHPCEPAADAYLGSYYLAGESLVFHVFDGGWVVP